MSRIKNILFSVTLLLLTTACTVSPKTENIQLNPETLHLAWKKDTGGAIQQSPLSVKDVVVVMPGESLISTFDIESGESRWQFDTPAKLWPNSLSTTFDAVMIGGEGGRLAAMSARSGIGEWEIELKAEVLSPPLVDRYLVFAATSVVDFVEDQVSNQKAELLAINASTGEILWQHETANHALVTPVRGGDIVYVGGSQGETIRLYAFSTAEGELRWKYEVVDGAIDAIYANDDAVALLGHQGSLTAIDAHSGSLLWRVEFVANVSWLTGWENLIIFEDGAALRAWDILSGESVWEYQSLSKVVDQPILLDSELYLLTQAGEIINLNPQTGAESRRFSTDSETPVGMIITQGWLFIADEDGYLYAYTSQ
ncbi:MAG: PQQ-binding-like beta-propeller repeat protein [Anaerolineales bacterium]|nr:PQQ-binding-like beta-propeller repeat protein [Anaerolineales bacterium]